MSDGETTGDPFVSPDGRWVAMITKADVGSDVRILTTGTNGEESVSRMYFCLIFILLPCLNARIRK